MSDKLKIKLSIADRVYPLTIDPKQEEGLRKATKRIDEVIKQFERNYAVRDKQDVLAMCALQFATQVVQKELDADDDREAMQERLAALDRLLDEKLA
ncbi:cell division protein ZapA [Croceiramulus getboli]|nr:cell division protein ZapA [Flavobacteriaceae bacterium YJPT1-3]